MLSKGHLKLIQNLKSKKQRAKHGLFIAEGDKIIHEILKANLKVKTIFSTNIKAFKNYNLFKDQLIETSPALFNEISSLSSPSTSLGIFQMQSFQFPASNYQLFLDQIQDPGNLGTIIRIADWYGIRQIHCKTGTVDLYNPKVLQASMGSFMRVQLNYIEDTALFFENNALPVLGTFMAGENIHKIQKPSKALIVIGNEGNGISSDIKEYCSQEITIPKFGEAESLNAAIATAIVLDNLIK